MYSWRVTEEEGHPVAWIDVDGHPSIKQPHHPNAVNFAPWESVEEATAWAEAEVAKIELQSVSAASIQQMALADSERLARIEEQNLQIIAALEALGGTGS